MNIDLKLQAEADGQVEAAFRPFSTGGSYEYL